MFRKPLVFKNQTGRRSLKAFLRETSGNVILMMGLSAIPIFLAAGAAVDAARITQEQAMFHAAAESAALAVATDDRSATEGLSTADKAARIVVLEGFALEYLKANYESSAAAQGEITVHVTVTGQEVNLKSDLRFPTTLMSLAGIDEVILHADTSVKKAMRPIELVMALDTTGSMDTSNKLVDAKAAAHTLLTTLFEGSLASKPRSEFLRVGLVPFSGAVKLDKAAYDFNINWIDTGGTGPYSKLNLNAIGTTPAAWNNYYAWSQLKSNATTYQSWNGCVETRKNGSTVTTDYNVNDVAPVSTSPDSLFPAYFNPDAYGTTVAINSYGTSWIGGTSTSAVGSECLGLTSGASGTCASTSTTNIYVKQENYRKYIDFVAGTESANPATTTSSYLGPWGGCAVSKMVPMTYDRAKVETGIDAMRSHGITVIPEGLAWAWRAISPTEPFTKVEGSGSLAATTLAPYGDPRWQKILVLMTDGDNNVNSGSYTLNDTRYSAYGFGSESLTNNRFGTTSSSGHDTALDTYMSSLCTKIKAAGITVYVASFGTDVSAASKTKLSNCSSGTGYYTHASTGPALQAFFDHIGQDVLNKSIYVSK